jgi:hypothetical protein
MYRNGIVTLLLIILILASACSKPKEPDPPAFVGDWEVIAADKGRCHDNFSFYKDGTVSYSRTGSQAVTGTYKHVEGDKYRMDYGSIGSDLIDIKTEGDKLITKFGNPDSKACTFMKK